ncbi:hypothetical protein PFISCL1PPCAC_18187, partial [Pristionchus fissidentatus]
MGSSSSTPVISEASEQEAFPFLSLPQELICKIISYVPYPAQLRVGCTCRFVHSLQKETQRTFEIVTVSWDERNEKITIRMHPYLRKPFRVAWGDCDLRFSEESAYIFNGAEIKRITFRVR